MINAGEFIYQITVKRVSFWKPVNITNVCKREWRAGIGEEKIFNNGIALSCNEVGQL